MLRLYIFRIFNNMVRFLNARQFFAVLVVVVFLSCQNRPQRIGMPAHFSAAIPDTLTVMSYNVENLFDMKDDGREYPEYKPDACNWTINTFTAKLNNIASVIAAVDPQIAVLVEVENENTVRELSRACSERKCVFPYFAIGDQRSGSNTRPVIMSRLPILWERSFGMVSGMPHERPMLEAAVFCGRDTLLVYACHWPSKKNPESSRVERARLLSARLSALPASQDFIVAGDFNENFDESETFRTSGLDDTQGETGVNHILGTMLSRPAQFARYVRPKDLVHPHSQGLFDPWGDVPEHQRFSAVFQGRRETPDHVLLPASLFDDKGFSYIDNSLSPFTWNGRLLKDGVPFRWQMRYAKQGRMHAGDGYSDHLPLVCGLARAPFRADLLDTCVTAGAGAGKRGGFENGPDGFIGCTRKIRVERDTLMPKSGRYCLRLAGTMQSNGAATRARLSIPKACGPDSSVLRMSLRGSGTINIRCCAVGSKQWIYFNGSDFSKARAGKYLYSNFTKWKTVRLPLGSLPPDATEAMCEIRTKKGAPLMLWVDDVSVRCRD